MGNYVGSKKVWFFSLFFLCILLVPYFTLGTSFYHIFYLLRARICTSPQKKAPQKPNSPNFTKLKYLQCNTPFSLAYCNTNKSALATCSLVLWKLEIPAFQNFTFCVISLTLGKKLLTEIAPAHILHTRHPSTSSLAQPSWKKKLAVENIWFVLFWISHGLLRSIQDPSSKGCGEAGGGERQCSLTVVVAKKNGKKRCFLTSYTT